MIKYSAISTSILAFFLAASIYQVNNLYNAVEKAFDIVEDNISLKGPISPETPEELYRMIPIISYTNRGLSAEESKLQEELFSDFGKKYRAYLQALRVRNIVITFLTASGIWTTYDYWPEIKKAIEEKSPFHAPAFHPKKKILSVDNPGKGETPNIKQFELARAFPDGTCGYHSIFFDIGQQKDKELEAEFQNGRGIPDDVKDRLSKARRKAAANALIKIIDANPDDLSETDKKRRELVMLAMHNDIASALKQGEIPPALQKSRRFTELRRRYHETHDKVNELRPPAREAAERRRLESEFGEDRRTVSKKIKMWNRLEQAMKQPEQFRKKIASAPRETIGVLLFTFRYLQRIGHRYYKSSDVKNTEIIEQTLTELARQIHTLSEILMKKPFAGKGLVKQFNKLFKQVSKENSPSGITAFRIYEALNNSDSFKESIDYSARELLFAIAETFEATMQKVESLEPVTEEELKRHDDSIRFELHDVIEEVATPETKAYQAARAEAEAVEEELTEFARDKKVIQQYIKATVQHYAGYETYLSMNTHEPITLDAIAAAMNINIVVYQRRGDGKITLFKKIEVPGATETRYLLHAGIHFDGLRVIEKSEEEGIE